MDIICGRESGPRPCVNTAPIYIGRRAWIGLNAIILKGVRIGEGSVVSPGAVVINDVAPNTVVLGNPARAVVRVRTNPNTANSQNAE
jgi:acetyltransferase-like isoleucine patch superfamily enzyme